MTLLSTIAKPEKRPLIATIVGEGGTGKSGLAASFPKPIFIRAEDGLGRISQKVEAPDAFPTVTTGDQVFDQLLALLNETHSYETLVIDSTTALDQLFTDDILKKDGRAKNLQSAAGGYGAGFDLLAAAHGRVRKAAGLLNVKKAMNIIFIAHADLEVMRLPEIDDYSRYSLKLSKRAHVHYVENVDLVGFVRLQKALRGDDDERKKIVSNGDREFVCYATAASVSKNGLSITEPLDFEEGTNPLAPYLTAPEAKPAKRKPKSEPVEEETPDASDVE